jgi:GntR family transcriptional repressor for pyruvate dehydrogenase complex
MALTNTKKLEDHLWRIDPGGLTPTPITEAIQRHLELLIQKGFLRPGDRLPGEHELARLIGVSRTVVREALNGLRTRGLMVVSPGRGTFISRVPPQTLKDLLLLETITVDDLDEARVCVETTNARLAALRHGEEDMDKLWALQREAENGLDAEDWVALDGQLHVALAKATQNEVLVRFTRDIKQLLTEQSRRIAYLPGRVDQATKEHRRLLEAVQKCDPMLSEKMMRRHLNRVRVSSHEILQTPQKRKTHLK